MTEIERDEKGMLQVYSEEVFSNEVEGKDLKNELLSIYELDDVDWGYEDFDEEAED
ncbi:MAG TPA: hypothetical protein VGE45_01985 [Chloroflexia bacterium]